MVLDLVVEPNADTYSSNELPDNDLVTFIPASETGFGVSPRHELRTDARAETSLGELSDRRLCYFEAPRLLGFSEWSQ